jgi:hypothetical protein
MLKKISFILFIPLFFICFSCRTAEMKIFYIDTGIIQFFFPPTEWSGQGSKAKAVLDITYRTGAETPAFINISFIGSQTMPRQVTSAFLKGNGIEYPLENVAVIFPEPREKLLRVTTRGNRDTLATVLSGDSVVLVAEIDGITYTYTPSKDFISLKNEFVMMIQALT